MTMSKGFGAQQVQLFTARTDTAFTLYTLMSTCMFQWERNMTEACYGHLLAALYVVGAVGNLLTLVVLQRRRRDRNNCLFVYIIMFISTLVLIVSNFIVACAFVTC